MSETNNPRQLLTAVAKTPRRLFVGGLTALITAGGVMSMAAAPAAVAAAPTTHAATSTPHVLAVRSHRFIDQD